MVAPETYILVSARLAGSAGSSPAARTNFKECKLYDHFIYERLGYMVSMAG